VTVTKRKDNRGYRTSEVVVPVLPGELDLGKGPAAELIWRALNRLRLALSEVRVQEERRDGKCVKQWVANHDAIVRARKCYAEAAHAVGVVRRAEGLCDGPQRPTRGLLRKAEGTLEEYRVALERLQGLS
jgi:hypothetical protein